MNPLENVDLALLKQQKNTFVSILEYLRMNKLPAEVIEHLEGILDLLDSVQDYCEDLNTSSLSE